MNKLIPGILLILFCSNVSFGQKPVSEWFVMDSDRKQTSIQELTKNESLIVVSFWASWCKPCIAELNAISDEIEDWKEEVNFEMVAVAIDDARSSSKVKSAVNGNGWDFIIALDENQDLKRRLGINNIPYTIILKDHEIVYRRAGYLPGDEQIMWEKIQKLDE